MSKSGNNPPVDKDIDFNTGYEVSSSCKKSFSGQSVIEPRIMIEKDVFEELQKHANETVEVELCGVLVGTTYQDDSGKYLVINGSIRGEHSKNEGTQVAFTHETWDYIHKEMESRFNDYKIVGWYHTHPGFGIFLSEMDKFIQDYFFNQPFQVALVIDPISSKTGLFAWINGKIRSLSRCWIGNEMQKLTSGAVGCEEIHEQHPEIEEFISGTSSSDVAPEKEVEELSLNAKSGIRLLPLLLAFFVGLSLSNVLLQRSLFNAALVASRAETRELLGAWASDTAVTKDFKLLQVGIADLSEKYLSISSEAEIASASVASFCLEITSLKSKIDELAFASIERRKRVHSALESVTNKNVISIENHDLLMVKLKEVLAESLLIQLIPFINALALQTVDVRSLQDIQILINHIVELNPKLEPNLRRQLPWLFP